MRGGLPLRFRLVSKDAERVWCKNHPDAGD